MACASNRQATLGCPRQDAVDHARRCVDRSDAQSLLGHGKGGSTAARAHIEHGMAGSKAERRDCGVRELQGEGLEHPLVHADVIVPSLRLLVRLKVRR